jgi:hypothetical protein
LDGRVLKKKVKIGDEFLLGEVEEQFHFFEVRERKAHKEGAGWANGWGSIIIAISCRRQMSPFLAVRKEGKAMFFYSISSSSSSLDRAIIYEK